MATINGKNYLQHAVSAYNDERIVRLRIKHKAAGYGIYWMLIEYLRNSERYMSGVDYNTVAYVLREDAALIKSVVENFGLFAFTEDGKCFYSEELNDQMAIGQKKSEACKKSIEHRWSKRVDNQVDSEVDENIDDTNVIRTKYERNTNVLRTYYDRNTNSENRITNVLRPNKDQNSTPPVPPISNNINNIYNINHNEENKENPNKLGSEKEEKMTGQAPSVVEQSSTTSQEENEGSLSPQKKSASERAQDFYEKLIPYVERYGRETVRDFYDYWSEYSTERSKLRFEKQPTWNLAMRLATWKKREKQYTDDRNRKYRTADERKQEANEYGLDSLRQDLRRIAEGESGRQRPEWIPEDVWAGKLADGGAVSADSVHG